jgi:hypothetical protein
MAPEQWDGQGGDARTDVYSLGVILYVALTGKAPFKARTAEELAEQHRRAPVPDVRSEAPGVDRDLALLIAWCMAKRPEDRPQDMNAILHRLQGPAARRNYALSVLGVAVISLLAVVLAGFGIWRVFAGALLVQVRPSLARLAELVARDLQAEDLDQVRTMSDIGSPAWQRVLAILVRYKKANPEVKYVYTMRRTDRPGTFAFVVDEDWLEKDDDGDGVISEDETLVQPGRLYDGRHLSAMVAVLPRGAPTVDAAFDRDAWGVTISGYAPVLRRGRVDRYFVGVDVGVEQLEVFRTSLTLIFGLAWLGLVLAFALWRYPRERGPPKAPES